MNMDISHCYSTEQAMNMVKDISHHYSTEQPISIPVNMLDPIRIRSGLAGKHWPEAGQMILAHRLCFRTGSIWTKRDTIRQN